MHHALLVRARFVLAVFLVLLAGSDAAAWDGQRAILLTERLDVEIAATVSAAEGGPDAASVREERQRDAALAEVPALQGAVTALLGALRDGGDRDATRPYLDRVQKAMEAVVSSADDNTPRKATLDRWEKSLATLRELGRLYAED